MFTNNKLAAILFLKNQILISLMKSMFITINKPFMQTKTSLDLILSRGTVASDPLRTTRATNDFWLNRFSNENVTMLGFTHV